MNRRKRTLSLLSIAITLALSTLACQIDIGGPEPGLSPLPAGSQEAGDVRQTWEAALASAASSGEVMLLLDESQMTAFLADRMREQDAPLLENPQVFLREGSIQVFGTTKRGILQMNVSLVIKPTINADGEIELQLEEAQLGPLPAPQAIKETLSALLTEAFTGPVGTLATGLRLKSIAIADGQMAITGELR